MGDTENVNKSEAADVDVTVEGEEKAKRKLQRKPLWLCIPTAYEVIPTEGVPLVDAPRKPVSYSITQCHTKAEIQAALTAAQIDVTNSHHVLLFRALPVPLQLQSQVLIKW